MRWHLIGLLALLVLGVAGLCSCTVVSRNRAFPTIVPAWSKAAKLEREYRQKEKEYDLFLKTNKPPTSVGATNSGGVRTLRPTSMRWPVHTNGLDTNFVQPPLGGSARWQLPADATNYSWFAQQLTSNGWVGVMTVQIDETMWVTNDEPTAKYRLIGYPYQW